MPAGRGLCNIGRMRLAWIAAALLAATACEPAPSKLDKLTPAGGAIPSGDLEARVARLEQKLGGVEPEALQFLSAAFEQRMEQETKPQPGTVYGVDIAQNLELGQVEGSPEALVTIIEAWDFA